MGGYHGSVPCILSLFVVSISCLSLGLDFSELVCRGRCSAAELNTNLEKETCISRCCVHSPGDTANNTFPVDCPLLGYNSCSTPDTPPESPDLSIENGTILLRFNTDVLLDKGIPLALAEQSSEISSNNTQVILVKSVHLSSQVVNYQLFYAGARNELDLKVTDCYNVSLAVINECGMSGYSAIASFFPPYPNPPSNLKFVSTMLKDKSPNVTVSWQYKGPVDAVVNISLVVEVQNPSLGCVNVSKTVNGSQNEVNFMQEDFSNNSVWLCFYHVAVLVSYVLPCQFDSQVQTQSAHLKSEQVLLEEAVTINITDAELIWNTSSLAYSLKLSWTVPEIYNLSHSLVLFKIFKDIFSQGKRLDTTYPATAGKLNYEAVVFEDKLKPRADGYSFVIAPIVSSHMPMFNYRPPPAETDKLNANGEPPSSVINVTVTEKDRNTLQINWQEPAITNGNITQYIVSVTVYEENGNFSQVNTTAYNNSYVLDMTILQETNISISVAAVNMFGTGNPSAHVTYTRELTDVGGGGIQVTPPSNVGVIVAGVVVPLVIFGIVCLIVVIIVYWHLRRKIRLQLTKYSDLQPSKLETILNPKEDNYKLYFKRLPPAMVDRWVIPLHMFNSESFHLLGEGNFSSVYFSMVRGPLSTPTKLDQFKNYAEESVAVKLLKGNASEVEMEAFLNEAEILKTLSTQSCPYVVHLVGLQLEHAPPMIAMELVPCGNLLDILKSSSLADEGEPDSDMIAMISPMHPQNMLRRQSQRTLVQFQRDRAKSIDSYIHLRSYSLPRDSLSLPSEIAIKPSQLLKFAIEVNRGMDYLQSFGILHRDLACRNLLLSASGIVKISDFGFACFLDGETEIVAELPTDSKPLRWMSPEAFEDDLFSEASDVWSFGVTLWELFSQGKFPYPTLSDSDVLAAVKAGNCLECPEKCDEKVYNLMLSCWKLSHKDRPQFSVLKKTLEGFMYDLYPYIQPE